jgi:hypothetical protein
MSQPDREDLSAKMASPDTPPPVDYGGHLWQTANIDAWAYVRREDVPSIGSANFIFIVTTLLSYCWLGTDNYVHFGFSVLIGLAALGVTYGIVVAVHLLYLTPRKLLAGKQDQAASWRDTVRAKETEVGVLKRLLARKTVAKHERVSTPRPDIRSN